MFLDFFDLMIGIVDCHCGGDENPCVGCAIHQKEVILVARCRVIEIRGYTSRGD